MQYGHIVQATFLERPNRFIAHVELEGNKETVHVKNTGRCKELLIPGAKVYLEKCNRPGRSTMYDLVAVEKNGRMINMDSQAPNKAVEEWLRKKALFPDLVLLRPETKYGNSRFDFYAETKDRKIFIEVKGVTREQDNVVCFPDAPSVRAIKHLQELISAKKEGYEVYVIFVVQMEEVSYFTPDVERHAEFAKVLKEAFEQGVNVLAYECKVTPQEMYISGEVPVKFDRDEKSLDKVYKNESFTLLSDIPKPLIRWYDTNKRDLPWRKNISPYRVWVSEIMLQQTRVEAVKPYFERFMKELPDIRSLAACPEEKLLKLWEGLGYYNRVRNMQKAAIEIVNAYDGKMPQEYEKIRSLCGIGSYTAGAISSIAFRLPYPAVDGNVLRVLARIRRDDRCISDDKVKKAIEAELTEVMPKDKPGSFNQAMMELGACVCLPTGMPRCEECPLEDMCMAHRFHAEMDYPKKAPKKSRTIEEKTVLILLDGNRTALHKRPEKGLLAGMYEFPMLEGKLTPKQVKTALNKMGLKVLRITPLEEAVHVFTHKEWHMTGYMIRVDELEQDPSLEQKEGWLFIEPVQVQKRYPIPSAFEYYAKYLQMKIGSKRLNEMKDRREIQ